MATVEGDSPMVSPEEAFSVLGNETRIAILQTLGEVDEPLTFTELRDRIGFRQGEQFNYHLEKLVGHFVEKTATGYVLRQPGYRVVQAVLSGAVTREPVMEPTTVDWWSCPYCGGQVVIGYVSEQVHRYCRECEGLRGSASPEEAGFNLAEHGYLDSLYLPPAGVQNRGSSSVLKAAFTWAYAEWLVAANDVCPRCSAVVERSIRVCEEHDPDERFCNQCGHQHAIGFETRCTNCRFTLRSIGSMHVVAATEVIDFISDHGINPISDPWDWGWEYDEEIVSLDPLRATFTFSIDDETLEVTVDQDLTVIDSSRSSSN